MIAEILGGAGEAIADLKQLFLLAENFGYSDWIQFDASVVRGLSYTLVLYSRLDYQYSFFFVNLNVHTSENFS